MKLCQLLFLLPGLWAQPLVIDCGSATDQDFTSPSTAFTDASLGAGSLSTLRFGPRFSYRIPAAPGVYLVRLLFVEPNQTQPLRRLFKVSVNGQESPVLDLVALAGPKTVYTLTTPAVSYWGQIVLDFTGICTGTTCNAIVNTIEVERSAVPLTLQAVAQSYECIKGTTFASASDQFLPPLVVAPGFGGNAILNTSNCTGIRAVVFTKVNGGTTTVYLMIPYWNAGVELDLQDRTTWRPAPIP